MNTADYYIKVAGESTRHYECMVEIVRPDGSSCLHTIEALDKSYRDVDTLHAALGAIIKSAEVNGLDGEREMSHKLTWIAGIATRAIAQIGK